MVASQRESDTNALPLHAQPQLLSGSQGKLVPRKRPLHDRRGWTLAAVCFTLLLVDNAVYQCGQPGQSYWLPFAPTGWREQAATDTFDRDARPPWTVGGHGYTEAEWEQVVVFISTFAGILSDDLSPTNTAPVSILESACSGGEFLSTLALRLPPHSNVTGFDTASLAVQRAKYRMPNGRFSVVSLTDELSMATFSDYDYVFALDTLHYPNQPTPTQQEKGYAALLRATRRSLTMVMNHPDRAQEHAAYKSTLRHTDRVVDVPTPTSADPAGLSRMCENANGTATTVGLWETSLSAVVPQSTFWYAHKCVFAAADTDTKVGKACAFSTDTPMLDVSACGDDQCFRDKYGHACAQWSNGCGDSDRPNVSGGLKPGYYAVSAVDDVRSHCIKTCGLCEKDGVDLKVLAQGCKRRKDIANEARLANVQLVLDFMAWQQLPAVPTSGTQLGITRHNLLASPWDEDFDFLTDIESARSIFNFTDSVVVSGGPEAGSVVSGEYIEHGQSDGVPMYRQLYSPGRHRGMKTWLRWLLLYRDIGTHCWAIRSMYTSMLYIHTAPNLTIPPALGWHPTNPSSGNGDSLKVSTTPELVVSRVKQASRWRQTLKEDPEQGITDVTHLHPGQTIARAFRQYSSLCRPTTEQIVSKTGETGVDTNLAVDGCIAIRTFSIRTAGAGVSLMGERRGRARKVTGDQSWQMHQTKTDLNYTGLDLIRIRSGAVHSNRMCLSFVMKRDGTIKVIISLGCSGLTIGIHDTAADLFPPACSGRGPDQCQDEDATMIAGAYATTTWLNFPLLLRAAVQEQRFAIESPLRAQYRVVEGVRLQVPSDGLARAHLNAKFGPYWSQRVYVCPHSVYSSSTECMKKAKRASFSTVLTAMANVSECSFASDATLGL